MSEDDVIQIRVGNSPVGVIGLKAVIAEVAEVYGERPDLKVKSVGSVPPKSKLIKWLKEAADSAK